MKTCRKCGAEKPRAEFYAHKLTSDGLNSYCKRCVTDAAVAWKKANPCRAAASQKKWNDAHPETLSAATKKWRRRRREHVRRYANAWIKAHPAEANARNSRHRAEKLQATPAWANKFFISEAYELAQLRTQVTGFQWHVDHVVPLRSKRVCGLHVEHNLQVIPGAANSAKGNRHWPGMPEARITV